MTDKIPQNTTNTTPEPVVTVGTLDIPAWLFDLYLDESGRLLESLKQEITYIRTEGVTRDLVRICHTLGSISKTVGINSTARLGYAIEEVLELFNDGGLLPGETEIVNEVPDEVCASSICAASRELASHIADIQHKKLPPESAWVKKLEETIRQFRGDKKCPTESKSASLENLFSESDPSGNSSGGEEIPDWLSDLEKISEDAIFIPAAQRSVKSTTGGERACPFTADALPERLSTLAIGDEFEDDIDESIMGIFVDEASEIFSELYRRLETWQNTPDDKAFAKRTLHTLKGSSRMAGCMRFGAFIHNVEFAVESGLWGYGLPQDLLSVTDIISAEVDNLRQFGVAKTATYPASTHQDEMRMDEDFSLESITSPTHQEQDGVKKTVAIKTAEKESLRVSAQRMDAVSTNIFNTGVINQRMLSALKRANFSLSEMGRVVASLKNLVSDIELESDFRLQSGGYSGQKIETRFDALEKDRYGKLQELTRKASEGVSDLASERSVTEALTLDAMDLAVEQDFIIDDMRTDMIQSRVMKTSTLRTRFEKLIRQTCRDVGKQAHLLIRGDSDVDSGLLNRIVAPIEHILRNSITHGIETPDARLLAGKPEAGTVILNIFQQSNETHFEISDDGAGINRQAVEEKARARGIIGANEKISQERANALILESGLSTADKVTQAAGRGVGMDVARSDIRDMGGWLKISSTQGKGATFKISIPSYLSMISMAQVRVAHHLYGIPSSTVRSAQVFGAEAMRAAYISGMIVPQTENGMFEAMPGAREAAPVPIFYLGDLMGLGRSMEIGRNNFILFVVDGEKMIAVHVDGIEDEVRLPVKRLSSVINNLPGLVGASILSDGRPIIMINPSELAISATAMATNIPVEKIRTANDIIVMVVDDSITVRKVTENNLRRAGYNVILARDGLDAMEELRHNKPDIILTDIEMPNMDGFDLVNEIKTNQELFEFNGKIRNIPIIMISSRAVEKFKDHADRLGVNRYMGKPYNEEALVDAIRELTETAVAA